MDYRKFTVWFIMALLLFSAFATFSTSSEERVSEYATRSVILIHNVYELQNMSKNLNGHYALANDINATITKTWNNGAGFVPIGNSSAPFKGIFDGRGYKIVGLYINSYASCVGLFGYVFYNVTIENVNLVNVNVTANGDESRTGGLVGVNDGIVVNSSVRGKVSATGYDVDVGGLVGVNEAGVVSNSYAIVNVSTKEKSSVAGGLIGDNYVGNVENSYAIGNVSGGMAGGLLGMNEETVKNSYYDIDRTLINGGHYITIGGMYNAQFQDWLTNGKKLDLADYQSLVPDGEYYDISNVLGLKDLLGFAEDGLKFRLTVNIDLSSMPNFYIPYFLGTFDGANHTISNLDVSISFVRYSGFFGINKGTVENIGIVNASVSGDKVGGLIGWNYGLNYGNVENSYVTGNVSGLVAGGLVGINDGMVSNSYAIGNVKGVVAGGLVGENGGTVSDSYAVGSVNSRGYNSAVGGLAGENYGHGTFTASFWDVNTSGIYHSAGGIGLTTAEMMNESTFINAGWNFNTTWGIWNGKTYPFLRWQKMKFIPSAPRNIESKVGNGYVNLSWDAPSDNGGLIITGYNIYRNGTLIVTVSGTQLWYNDTGLKKGVNYTYYVTAVNAAGESPRSNEVKAMPSGEVSEFAHQIVILVAILVIVILVAVIYFRRKK